MFENLQRRRAAIFSAAVMVTVLAICVVPACRLLEHVIWKKPSLNLRARNKASTVIKYGVKALRVRIPGELIRGMVDPDHPEYGLVDFQRAALILAPEGNPGAEFILGWLCANGDIRTPTTGGVQDQSCPRIDFNKLGLTQEQQLAAQWYVLASMHGSSAASVALGNLLDSNYGGAHDKSLVVAAHFYNRGIEQGDIEARLHLAWSYAYGRGVKRDGAKAWKELEDVIKNGDEGQSIYAIVLAIQAWKEGKITPPKTFTRGASAYDFVRLYASAISGAQLDDIYYDPGNDFNPYPQYRRYLATEIRKDWLKNVRQ